MRRRHRRRPQHARAGFTLMELAVVMTIIAVVSAIALPRIGTALRNQRANAAARRVAADLALAAARAKATSATRTVVFNAAAGSYTLPLETPLDKKSGTYTVSLAAGPYAATIGEVNFNNTATASFDGFGRPASGGYVKVTVDGVTRTITLDADGGKAVIR